MPTSPTPQGPLHSPFTALQLVVACPGALRPFASRQVVGIDAAQSVLRSLWARFLRLEPESGAPQPLGPELGASRAGKRAHCCVLEAGDVSVRGYPAVRNCRPR